MVYYYISTVGISMSQDDEFETPPELYKDLCCSGEHTWFGYDIDRVRSLDLKVKAEKALFEQAVEFAKSIKQGDVGVKSDVVEDEAQFIEDDEEISVM